METFFSESFHPPQQDGQNKAQFSLRTWCPTNSSEFLTEFLFKKHFYGPFQVELYIWLNTPFQIRTQNWILMLILTQSEWKAVLNCSQGLAVVTAAANFALSEVQAELFFESVMIWPSVFCVVIKTIGHLFSAVLVVLSFIYKLCIWTLKKVIQTLAAWSRHLLLQITVGHSKTVLDEQWDKITSPHLSLNAHL